MVISFLSLQEFLPDVMSQNCEMQGCQVYAVKRIKSYFREYVKLWKKVWAASLLP